jgi:hypothetical protein
MEFGDLRYCLLSKFETAVNSGNSVTLTKVKNESFTFIESIK